MSDGERAELIALTELREAVGTLAANRGGYWTRAGSDEAHRQQGEQVAFKRVLDMIDGRINRDRKFGRESQGTGSGVSGPGGLDANSEGNALVLPAEVVPAAGA